MIAQKRSAYGQKTLPRDYLVDAAWFAAEQERLFRRHWMFVGRETAVAEPGQYMLTTVAGENLIVVRGQDGVVRAFYNVCRHRGTRICTTDGQASHSLQCPYHAWTYGLDGRLLGAPTMQDVAGFSRDEYGLLPVATAVWEGCVFVNLAEEPRPFAEAFAPFMGKFADWKMPSLQVGHQITYDVAANWKIIFHNYSECYHCPTIHPVLNELSPFRNAGNDLEEGPLLGGPMRMSMPEGSMTLSGRVCAPRLHQGNQGLVYYYTVFPTIFLSLFPDYVLIHRLEPLATDRTRVWCDWLFAPEATASMGGASEFNPQDAVEFWHMTNQQDWEVCELTQLGVQSRAYVPGPYADLESMLAAFDREYLRVMEGGT